MEWIIHTLPGLTAIESTGAVPLLQSEADAIALMEELYPHGARAILLRKEQFAPEFFELCNGLAGAFLQKFSTYRVRLAIVGDFSQVTSKALNAFIYESNQGSQVIFVENVETALKKFASAPAW